MSLQIVTGSSGAGKTYTIYRELIAESLAHPEKQYLVIVPEQFTMQAQKELVRMHPRHGLLNVDVLSFHRLAWRVFEEVGGNRLPILDETGKTLIIQRLITRNKKELPILGRTMQRQGAVSQMKSLLSELMQYGVQPEDLDAWCVAQGDSLLSRKLEDVATIYRTFREDLSDRFLAAEEIPVALCKVLARSERMRGSMIVLDGFTGFTPLQYKVIRELLHQAERVQVLLTLGSEVDPYRREDPDPLFTMSTETIRHLQKLADESLTQTLPIRRIDACAKSRFAKSPALAHLENELFRHPLRPYDEVPKELLVQEAADPRQELRMIAAEILRQVREVKGRHYRDFAIITGDLTTYGEEAAALFEAEGIPYYLDQTHSVMTNALVEGLRAVLQMVAKSYSYEGVFRYLRSGLSSLQETEIDELENYVLALGIRGRKRYEEIWEQTPRSIDPERLPHLNALRARFVEETALLHEQLHDRKGTIGTKTEALRTFLAQQDVERKIEELRERFLTEGEAVRAKEYEQILEAVTDLLTRTGEILEDEKSGVAALAELLDAGFAELSIGTIPPGEDQVMIGDMERTRLKNIAVLFFAGVNEGSIPRPVKGGGILSEYDRENLRRMEITLAPTPREEMHRQRFYLYLALTRPSEALILSYSRTDRKGEALLPSYLIGTLKNLFPKLEITQAEEDMRAVFETGTGRMQQLLGAIQKLPGETLSDPAREMLLWMRNDPQEEKRLARLLAAASTRTEKGNIGRQLAEKLYGKELVGSATRLERFAGCAFKHFCESGLRLQERDIFSFEGRDLGSVLHDALKVYGQLLQQEGRSWKDMDEETRRAYADRALAEVVSGYGNGILQSSHRNRFLTESIREVLHRTVWALQKQIEHGDFLPSEFEFAFHDGMEDAQASLPDGAAVRLTGRIDRFDVCETDDATYVKVIDYKSGVTTFDLNKLVEGLQIQLLLYLQAAIAKEEKRKPGTRVEPAGAFYYHIEDPILDEEDDKALTEEEREEKLLRMLRPNGRCRAESEILSLLDHDLAEGTSSQVVPVDLDKAGNPKKSAQIADGEEFRIMQDYTRAKIVELGNRILEGETKAHPYLYGDKTACDYCPYKGVCGFDPRLPGHRYRAIRKREADELFLRMRGIKKEETT